MLIQPQDGCGENEGIGRSFAVEAQGTGSLYDSVTHSTRVKERTCAFGYKMLAALEAVGV